MSSAGFFDDPLAYLSGIFGGSQPGAGAPSSLVLGGGGASDSPMAPSGPAPAAAASSPSPYGGMFGRPSWAQMLSLALSGAGDALNSSQKTPSNFLQDSMATLQMQRQIGLRAQLAQALQSGDPDAIRSAKAMALTMGMDLSEFQPKYQDVRPGAALVGIDPLTGKASEAYQAQMRTRPGYHWVTTPDGTQSEQFDVGGPADPNIIGQQAGARRKAIVNNPMPKQSGSSAAPSLVVTPPWQVFGGK